MECPWTVPRSTPAEGWELRRSPTSERQDRKDVGTREEHTLKVQLQEENVEGRRMLEKGSQEGQEAREEFRVAGWHIGCWQSCWGLQVNERDLVSTS